MSLARRLTSGLSLWLLAAGCARPAAPRDPSSIADAVTLVERRLATLRVDTVSAEGYSLEGTMITGHYDGASLRRLRAEYFGETGRALETFWYDSSLVLVERIDIRYDEPLSGRTADSTAVHWFVGRDTIWSAPGSIRVAGPEARRVADSLQASAAELHRHFSRPAAPPGA